MIQFISKIPVLRSLLPKKIHKPLGRWSLDYGLRQETKASLSNEDHCGPCGQYAMQKKNENVQALIRKNSNMM